MPNLIHQGKRVNYNGKQVISLNHFVDNFDSYIAGNLAGQGNWLSCLNNIGVAVASGNGGVYPGTSVNIAAVKRSETFLSNHYSQITINSPGSNQWIGVSARTQGESNTASYYSYIATASARALSVIVNGTEYGIASGPGISDNDVLRIEVQGSTITCYRNGVIDTSMGIATSPATGNNGVYIDTRLLNGGTPGISGWGYNTYVFADNWKGGNL